MNGASFFGSLLTTKDVLFSSRYEDIASHFNSGLSLSLLHMRNCPVAFAGTLEYINLPQSNMDEEVKVDGADVQR